PNITGFDDSCFTGNYITGDVDAAYLDAVEKSRQKPSAPATSQEDDDEGGNAAQQIEMFVRRPGQE
ncbi:MAG: amidophosphoribosyltransferase, partial [Rhodocyclales bacterium]|nr:amidophosphoribosyltransferase [Rhodocyclales bacterium]